MGRHDVPFGGNVFKSTGGSCGQVPALAGSSVEVLQSVPSTHTASTGRTYDRPVGVHGRQPVQAGVRQDVADRFPQATADVAAAISSADFGGTPARESGIIGAAESRRRAEGGRLW